MRRATVERKTNETAIRVEVDLDGTGQAEISTGVGFFDHMLDQIARHALFDLKVEAKGDLHIDDHHTVEDTGIALGQAIREALGDKRGVVRYADCHLAMDEALTRVALDFSGRPDHHVAESCCKGVARALRQAVSIDERTRDRIPSTKGSLSG